MKIHVNFRHPLNNLCYVLSEALYHNWGKENGLRPYHAKLKDCPGVRGGVMSHWWLQDESGKVYDLTAGQFDVDFPYHLGKPCGFLTQEPSRRCRELMTALDGARKYRSFFSGYLNSDRRKHGTGIGRQTGKGRNKGCVPTIK
jgi:hypothetical protein